ncbi:hypothetical protein HOD75_02410 [archaeon]|nr:hypothetical protein [archaeon]MBT4241731.1 hypothetical protein [archaeon]
MDKRAIMWKFFIAVLVLVISLAVILLLYYGIDWSSNSDKKICHQSIVLRSSVTLGDLPTQEIVPLNCKTEKICLNRGDKCSEFGFEEKIRREKISSNEDKAKEDVLELFANELYDCHDTVGRGLLQFMPKTWSSNSYCLMCSRIALDEESKELVKEITYLELYAYMKNKKVDGVSLLERTYGIKRLDDMEEALNVALEINNKKTNTQLESIEDFKIDLTQENAIVVQMSPDNVWKKYTAGTLGAVGGGALVVGGIVAAPFSLGSSLSLTAVGIGVVAGGATGGVIYSSNFAEDDSRYVYPTVYPYTIESLRGLECSSFETAP